MGQARLRGTQEERVKQAVEAREALEAKIRARREEADRKEMERVAAMSPEDRKRYSQKKHEKFMTRATMLGLIGALDQPDIREKTLFVD